MNARILNRANTLPEDGWYQIEVTGEHPAGRDRRQLIDQRALQAIVDSFRTTAAEENFGGLPIDRDHLSRDLSQTTEAHGWLHEVAIRNGQLWGRIEWTDLGEAAIRNKRFKFFSTEYDPPYETVAPGLVRPLRLVGLALTNRPNNIGGKPITNRKDNSPSSSSAANNKTEDEMDTKTIAKKLGLPDPDGATEEQILNRAGELVGIESDHRKATAEREADTILNRHADRVPAEGELRDSLRETLILNREHGEKLIGTLPLLKPAEEKPDPERIHNRKDTKQPASVTKSATDAADAKQATAIRNRAKELHAAQPRRDYRACFEQAEAEYAAKG